MTRYLAAPNRLILCSSVIPAQAEPTPAVIPAEARIYPIRHSRGGRNLHPIRHSRKGRNPPRPSFPRRRESTIPAHAGIHRPTTPAPEKNTPSFPQRRESITVYLCRLHHGQQTRENVHRRDQQPERAGVEASDLAAWQFGQAG